MGRRLRIKRIAAEAYLSSLAETQRVPNGRYLLGTSGRDTRDIEKVVARLQADQEIVIESEQPRCIRIAHRAADRGAILQHIFLDGGPRGRRQQNAGNYLSSPAMKWMFPHLQPSWAHED